MTSNSGDAIFAILVRRPRKDCAPAESANIAAPGGLTVIRIGDDLMPGVAQARKLGCTHVVAFSNDAASHAGDLPALQRASGENPAALVIGYRAESTSSHRLGHLLLRLETGLHLRNIHGPRVYPLKLFDAIDPQRDRCFGEAEILVRAAWAGCPIIETPIPSPPPVEHSHSLPTRRKLRELALHVRLIARALSGWPHPKYDSGIVRPARRPFWPRVWRWLNPFAAWRELRQGGISRNEMAVGLAAGAFIGNMPAWGFHTAISLYVAKRLHLNPLAVMTGSHVSAPPMGIAIVASAMWLGHVILHGVPPKWENITPFHGKFMEHLASNLLDWSLGAVLVGTALAIVTYIVANFLFRFVERPSPGVSADGATLSAARPEPHSPLSAPPA